MPPPLADVSDDESTGGSIPYDDSVKEERDVKEEKDVKTEDDDNDDEDEEEEGEDVYIVEKILSHDFAKKGGGLLLQVKWKGYDDPADLTWEPEENLENAADAVQEYYRQQGGRPEKQVRKRKSFAAAPKAIPEKPEKPEPKKRRKSRADTDADTEATDEVDAPNWMPKTKKWEDEVIQVDTIMRDPETGTLIAYLHWKNGKKSKVSIELCYDRCPKKMLEFYEKHLVFKDA